jgi:tungstate transport system permease protein
VNSVLHELGDALGAIARLDPDLLIILGTTLRVSVTSTLLASVAGLPLGFLLAARTFRGKPFVLACVRTALALPTVLIALFVYSWIARSAPLGRMNLLFTPAAIVIGQTLLIIPLVTALSYGVLHPSIRTVYEEARLLGASPLGAFWKVIAETRVGVTAAVMTAFGRVASEIGISLMLGGNIRGLTRTVTTAIALETGQGDFHRAVALGLLLLCLVLLLNLGIQLGERLERV